MIALQSAIRYAELGCSVIPVGSDKRPLLSWRPYQSRRATRPEIISWFKRWPAGVGIVCGRISGLVVLDADPRNGDGLTAIERRLPPTATAETGGGGRHFYFTIHEATTITKVPALLPGVDLQAEASYVVAPPSVHPSGRRYCWLPERGLGDLPLAPLPAFIRQLIALRFRPEEDDRSPGRRGPHRMLSLTLDQVLSLLHGVRRSGRGWVARCPAHDDREPSLSVAEDGGRLLLHCFAGCSFNEIRDALRQEVAR